MQQLQRIALQQSQTAVSVLAPQRTSAIAPIAAVVVLLRTAIEGACEPALKLGHHRAGARHAASTVGSTAPPMQQGREHACAQRSAGGVSSARAVADSGRNRDRAHG